jgi:toxin ParE1/3/4
VATVKWTQRAKGDLQDVYDFIMRDSPRAADALVERIIHASERLVTFPESGRIMPEFPALPYREILVGNYRVLYRIEGEVVWIAAVVHGRRLLRGVE